MSYTTPQLDAAAAVAAMLTGREIAGFTLDAKADELLPTYDQSKGDLATLHIDCVPAEEYTFSPLDRESAEELCPVNIGVQVACGKEDQTLYRQLIALLNGIAKVVTLTAPEGFSRPREDVTVRDSAAHLEQGIFYGVVIVNYVVVTEAAA